MGFCVARLDWIDTRKGRSEWDEQGKWIPFLYYNCKALFHYGNDFLALISGIVVLVFVVGLISFAVSSYKDSAKHKYEREKEVEQLQIAKNEQLKAEKIKKQAKYNHNGLNELHNMENRQSYLRYILTLIETLLYMNL